MLFSSLSFLYYFVPAVLAVYFLTPAPQGSPRYRNLVLLLASIVFYAWASPLYLIVMLAELIVLWVLGLLTNKYIGTRLSKLWLALFVLVSLGALGFFKYADFFTGNLNALLGTKLSLLKLALPVGISFYTFKTLSYGIDLYKGKIGVQKNPLDFACYVMLFPQLMAGPISRYADLAPQLVNRKHSLACVSRGVRRFVIGLAKKVLIANLLGELVQILRTSGEKSVLSAWLYILAFTLNIYFDFSGYSDMAIGLGCIFGFDFPENFDYPYTAQSISDFWRRWHMSLSSWFRDYVYIPMGGNRVKTPRYIINILVVWLLTGFWHGANWTFMAWGVYFGLILLFEKFVFGKALKKLPRFFRHVYVMLVVCVGWVFFDATGFAAAGQTLGQMFGFSASGLLGGESLYYLRSYALPLIIGVAGCLRLPRRLFERIEKTRAATVLEPVAIALLLAAVTAFLVDGSFNPFIYFKF